jgi:hypothetical protein
LIVSLKIVCYFFYKNNYASIWALTKKMTSLAPSRGGVKALKILNTAPCAGDAHKNGRIKRGLFKCPRTGKAINADLNSAVNILHTPESLGARSRGQLLARDGLKASLVYCWTSGAGWVKNTR